MGRSPRDGLQAQLREYSGVKARRHTPSRQLSTLVILLGGCIASSAARGVNDSDSPTFPPSFPDFPPPSSPSSTNSAGWTVIVGVLLGLAASIGINTGNNLQAVGLAIQQRTGKAPRIWYIGVTTFAIASIANFGAFGFAPASILAPLDSIQFVTNLMFGKFFNKARIKRRMVFGSALIIFGCLFAVLFGPKSEPKLTLADLASFWAALGWIAYCSFIFGFVVAAQVARSALSRP